MTPPSLPYWHVDAFADLPFSGNQAAVLLLDAWLPDATLRAIAAENMFAETAFLVREGSDEADWELRWFTPAVEVDLCGHATLAAAHVLLEANDGHAIRFRTRKASILQVRRTTAGYELALAAISVDPAEWTEAAELLGPPPRSTWSHPSGYWLFVYSDEDEIRAQKNPLRCGVVRLRKSHRRT